MPKKVARKLRSAKSYVTKREPNPKVTAFPLVTWEISHIAATASGTP